MLSIGENEYLSVVKRFPNGGSDLGGGEKHEWCVTQDLIVCLVYTNGGGKLLREL